MSTASKYPVTRLKVRASFEGGAKGGAKVVPRVVSRVVIRVAMMNPFRAGVTTHCCHS